jgi:hypothetical protein
VTIDEIHNQTVELGRTIMDVAPGSVELGDVVARIRELQDELERARGALGPLVPDAASPKSPEETSADDLAVTLANLMTAAAAKQSAAPASP